MISAYVAALQGGLVKTETSFALADCIRHPCLCVADQGAVDNTSQRGFVIIEKVRACAGVGGLASSCAVLDRGAVQCTRQISAVERVMWVA